VNEFQARLDAAFPASTDQNVARGVREGIVLADDWLKGQPFLRGPLGRDIRGHVRRCGILFRVHEMAEAGDLPFASTVLPMPRGNWHWVELQSSGIKSHICRSESPAAFPEDTPTRQDERLVNQFHFDFMPKPVETDLDAMFAWLTYGIAFDGSLGHLCWAMPASTGDTWLARTNILVRLAETEREANPETASKSLKLKFKDHIEDALNKDSEQDNDAE
jgi:hypothetical protein